MTPIRHVEEVIALGSNFSTAQSAYDEAVKRRPGKLITLRQKARVIKKKPMMLGDRCGEQVMEIDRYGERLAGCIECNRWSSDRSAFVVELSVEEVEAVRAIRRRSVPPCTTA